MGGYGGLVVRPIGSWQTQSWETAKSVLIAQGFKWRSCTATRKDIHTLGSSLDDQREGKSSCYKHLYPNGYQWLPYGGGDVVKTTFEEFLAPSLKRSILQNFPISENEESDLQLQVQLEMFRDRRKPDQVQEMSLRSVQNGRNDIGIKTWSAVLLLFCWIKRISVN